jgi:hypothetical protein
MGLGSGYRYRIWCTRGDDVNVLPGNIKILKKDTFSYRLVGRLI